MAGDSGEATKAKGKKGAKESGVKAVDGAKAGQQLKKKKKNPPDRPQPAWLFPPDEENPVLNPKVLTEEEKKKMYDDRINAIRFLKYKSASAPMRTAPPGLLLTLIGAFLGTYGFNSTSRLFTLECNARKKLDGWEDEIGKKLEKGMPDLVKIFKDWSKEWHERRELGMTSSDSEDDAVTKRAKMVKKRESIQKGIADGDEDTSSSEDSDSSNSGGESGAAKASTAAIKASKPSSSSGSTSSSTSDSDADDEKDTRIPSTTTPSALDNLVNKLKRKTPPDFRRPVQPLSKSSSTSTSSDTSDSEAHARKRVKTASGSKVAVNTTDPKSKKAPSPVASAKANVVSSSGSSSPSASANSSSSDSDSDDSSVKSMEEKPVNPSSVGLPPITNGRQSSTDSSTTLKDTSLEASALLKECSTSSSPSSDSSSSSNSSTSDSEAPAKKSRNPVSKVKTVNKGSTAPPKPTNSAATAKSSSGSSTSDSEASAKKSKNPTSQANASSKGSTALPKPANSAANTKGPKKTNVPFSRVPPDTKVDPKLASNAYVPYDYAEKAHQDLSVTKGKGFTKEKNKKKRGA
jgi:hypothetical protein